MVVVYARPPPPPVSGTPEPGPRRKSAVRRTTEPVVKRTAKREVERTEFQRVQAMIPDNRLRTIPEAANRRSIYQSWQADAADHLQALRDAQR